MVDGTRKEGWDSANKYIAGAIVGGLVFVIVPETARWIHGGAFGQTASTPLPAVNGNCNVFGNNNINCNTFNLAPAPFELTPQLANDMLAKMPDKKKKVIFNVSGPSQETFQFGNHAIGFFRSNGYDVNGYYTAYLEPKPSPGISLDETPDSYIWTVTQP
jgi:hypothetical protein